jgi:phosphogluconate dehydratase
MYPNGTADVNHFHAAGGMALLIRTLLDAGLLHEDVNTIAGPGLRRYTAEPRFTAQGLQWQEGPRKSLDRDVLRTHEDPFTPDAGLRILRGNLGQSVVKTSAVPDDHRFIQAPARVFTDQAEFLRAFTEGELDRDLVAVVPYQGPAATGMPELHKLTPALGVLQDRGHRVALVTDGRMSGASGKVPAAIHITPEAAHGGPIGKVRDGDLVTLDTRTGTLTLHIGPEELADRPANGFAPSPEEWIGTGRELFAAFRNAVGPSDRGASLFTRPNQSTLPAHFTAQEPRLV